MYQCRKSWVFVLLLNYDIDYYNKILKFAYQALHNITKEFCAKDPAQILRWVITIDEAHDAKIHEYGLDTEFEDTFCRCI